MENETKGFEIGSLLQKSFKNELLTNYLSTGKQGFDDNYKAIHGDCDQFEQSTKHYNTYAYNAEKDKFVISTEIRNNIQNFYCEFTGSENFVAESQVEATNEYNHLYGVKYLHNQVWGETSFRGPQYHAGYVSKTKNAMVLFTLPTKIALRMVVMLPRLHIGGDVQNLRVLVSDERPGQFEINEVLQIKKLVNLLSDVEKNLIDPMKTVECGVFNQKGQPFGSLPNTLTCEKCLPYGKYVILQVNDPLIVNLIQIEEIAIYGIPLDI